MSGNTNDAVASGSQSHPCSPCVMTPGGTELAENVQILSQVAGSGRISPWRPDTTPEMASPTKRMQNQHDSTNDQAKPTKITRRSLNLIETDIINIHDDSGSDGDNDVDDDKVYVDEEEDVVVDFIKMRRNTRRLRNYIVQWNEEVEPEVENVQEREIKNESMMVERIASINILRERNVNERGRWVTTRKSGSGKARRFTAAAPVDTSFTWSEDFSSFTGQKESYTRMPSPTFTSQDPVAIFHEIWDLEFIENIVKETNLYAWEVITQFSDPDMGTRIPDYMESWTDVTVEEIYRYFAILIFLPFDHRAEISEYWSTGLLEMPEFRRIMPLNRFLLINNFLHFVSNVDLSTRGHDRKIEKVAPVLDHCNRKFAEMYTPSQYLSLEESLLFGKPRLSWKHCMRRKAANFGIKSLELCEAETGYLLQYRLYSDKSFEVHPEPLHGFQDISAKIVLDLIEGYLDLGHVLVMDNWYNHLPITRYLKTRRTDVLGTLNRRQQGIPPAIKDLTPNDVPRGTAVSRNSGDITLVAYKDVKLVTVISTYHQLAMCLRKRAGKDILLPAAAEEYNRYMGGVDLKDQELSMFLMERQRNTKWYMNVFKRLLNTSLLNAYIIYKRNPGYRVYTHRDFRLKVTEGLLSRYPPVSSVPCSVSDTSQALSVRLQPGNHYPVYTKRVPKDGKWKRKQLRCVRCFALKRRSVVTVKCFLCQVPLCIGSCWLEYHTVLNLKSSES